MVFSKLSEYEGYLLPHKKILHQYMVWLQIYYKMFPIDYNSWSADGLISDEVLEIVPYL